MGMIGRTVVMAFGSLFAATSALAQAAPAALAPDAPPPAPTDQTIAASTPQDSDSSGGGDTDIFSKNTVSVLLDARMVVSNGERSMILSSM